MKVANSVKNGIFCELGLGAVDFRAIMAKLKKQKYIGWTVVEQDVLPGMGSPLESAIGNRNIFAGVGIVKVNRTRVNH
jgi:inosose dehydratase